MNEERQHTKKIYGREIKLYNEHLKMAWIESGSEKNTHTHANYIFNSHWQKYKRIFGPYILSTNICYILIAIKTVCLCGVCECFCVIYGLIEHISFGWKFIFAIPLVLLDRIFFCSLIFCNAAPMFVILSVFLRQHLKVVIDDFALTVCDHFVSLVGLIRFSLVWCQRWS